MKDLRIHLRTRFPASVKLMHASIGERILTMRDMSEGGVFLLAGEDLPLKSGDIVKIQIQGMPDEAPILEAEIIRKNHEGLALKFSDTFKTN